MDQWSRGDDGRPPRPQMSDVRPAPVKRKAPPNATITAMRLLWSASFVVGVTAALVAFLNRDGQLEELRTVVADLAPDFKAEPVESATATAYLVSLVAVGIVIVGELVLLRFMLDGHGRLRWALIPMVLVHALVALAATAVLALGQGGIFTAALLGAQLVLACVAVVASFLPKSGAWFHRQHESSAGIVA